MTTYEFKIVAGGLSIESEDYEDRFFESGCDDALLAFQRGRFILSFSRDAESFEEAVLSACDDVRSAGATVVRVEPDPLVSASDIAERADITRQAVSLYVSGDRGEGFPAPVACVSGSRPLWMWSEVAAWLHAAGKLDSSEVEAATLIDRINSQSKEKVRPTPIAEQALVARAPTEAMPQLRPKITNPRFLTDRSHVPDHRRSFNPRSTQSKAHLSARQ